MTEKQRDEGAEQTRIIVEAVKRARLLKGWSAAKLAEELYMAGIPWGPDTIVNLEHGRRKSIRVHEWLALAYVLEIDNPLELLVPGKESFPVIPGLQLSPGPIRAWLRGETPPLRQVVDNTFAPSSAELLESAAEMHEKLGMTDQAAQLRRLAALSRGKPFLSDEAEELREQADEILKGQQ